MRRIEQATLCIFFWTLILPLSSRAEEMRFFRIAGPVASKITQISASGSVTWTNAPTNATFKIQTTSSLNNLSNWVDFIQVPVTNPVTTQRIVDPNPPSGMAYIPAGLFTMGDVLGDKGGSEQPVHTVFVSAFYMDKYEVTKVLWDDVYNWALGHGYSFDSVALGKGSVHPAYAMTWFDAVKWCNARSEMEGKTPAYYVSAAQTTVYRSGQTNVQNDYVKWNAGYRLPTEAEWEKASRGGASGRRFSWSDADTITHSRANYYAILGGTSYDLNPYSGINPSYLAGGDPYTAPVGSFPPNGYGLYDTVGNAFEWCWDQAGPYSSASQTDPHGPNTGFFRVIRDGGPSSTANNLRTSYRFNYPPSEALYPGGFRCALPQSQ